MKLIFIHPTKEIVITPYELFSEKCCNGKIRVAYRTGDFHMNETNGLMTTFKTEEIKIKDILEDRDNEWICIDLDNYTNINQLAELKEILLSIDPQSLAGINYNIPKILNNIHLKVAREALIEPFKSRINEINREVYK